MIRFVRLTTAVSRFDKDRLAAVADLYRRAFPYYPQYAEKIVAYIENGKAREFDVFLLLAEGRKARVSGFALAFYFPKQKLGYLDYIASDPRRTQRGIGASLYEMTRDWLKEKKALGMLLDVPCDEVEKLKEPSRVSINKKRMAFYETYGARPIIGTLYDSVTTKANAGFMTSLVFDGLDLQKSLSKKMLKQFIPSLLSVKADLALSDPKVQQIINSVSDDPVKLRDPRYQVSKPQAVHSGLRRVFEVVNVGNAHQIHHLKEKGYCERPARVDSIMKGLETLSIRTHDIKRFGDKHIKAVHDAKLVAFLKEATKRLKPGQLIYPNIFPIRRPERIPRTWEMRVGYYCLDTFTPLTATAYLAARNAVNGTLTGAALVVDGCRLVYVVGRPPGHHAERKAFGGFCYFNNASIAAQYLSEHGRVALIDIDYHHGNGSQEIFYEKSHVYVTSIHGHPAQAYPYFAGFSDEKGAGPGIGFNRNFPLYPGVDDTKYLRVLDDAIKAMMRFKPDLLVVSLGLDTMAGDPTGTFSLTAKGIREVGSRLGKLGLPTLVVQEGGYSLRNLRTGAPAFLSGFGEQSF